MQVLRLAYLELLKFVSDESYHCKTLIAMHLANIQGLLNCISWITGDETWRNPSKKQTAYFKKELERFKKAVDFPKDEQGVRNHFGYNREHEVIKKRDQQL